MHSFCCCGQQTYRGAGMTEKIKNQKGFTLTELVIVMVVAAILLLAAAPKFVNLALTAKISATQAALATVRSTLVIKFAESGAKGLAVYPNSLQAADFANNKLPMNKLNGNTHIGPVLTPPSGNATHLTNSFWYIVATGEAGAYSDGVVDATAW